MSTFPILGVRSKPSLCALCPWSADSHSFVPDWVPASPKFALLLEGPGENEALKRTPLVGASGDITFHAFLRPLGLERADVIIANTLRCFASSKTEVLTSTGYRQMLRVQPGDLVLTHLGRFRSVLNKVRIASESSVIKIVRVDSRGHKSHYTVSLDHLFMTAVGWKRASDLRAGDTITVVAERCLGCGKVFNRGHKNQFHTLAFCSRECQGKFAPYDSEAISRKLKENYRNGTRDPYLITKAANAATRDLIREGKHNLQNLSAEAHAKSRLATAKTRELLGVGDFPWIGLGEPEVHAVLLAAGRDPVSQFSLGPFNFDFKVGNVLIEIDGPGTNNNQARVTERNSLKRKLAAEAGYSVIHVPCTAPDSILSLLDNDEHEYLFMESEVVEIAEQKWNRGIYSLSVEEDESYVAQGLVNHNCRGEANEYPDGQTRKKAEQICRQYDWYHGDSRGNLAASGIADWDPNLFVITLHPAAVLRENAYFFLVRRDFEKAARFMEQGYRVCVLCGDKAAALVLPAIEGTGGVSYWRGHYFKASLRTERKLLDTSSVTRAFRPVTATSWRRKKSKKPTLILPGDLF